MENVVRTKKPRIRRRRYLEDEAHHVYQRTMHRFNIFYDIEDYLVYYTIFAVAARQYGVTVLGLCLMIDHVHMLLKTETKAALSEFVRQVTSMFAREQNEDIGRSGSLFQARFGSAPKKGLKLLRTAIAYLYNNPVERGLCRTVEEYRWNFLPYATSSHPFSKPIVISHASRALKRAVMEVDRAKSQDRHLRYAQLSRLMKKLDMSEKEQLTDHIVSVYNPIAYNAVISCYGNLSTMLTAVNSNTGSEFDIKEDRYRFSDMEYQHMMGVINEYTDIRPVRKVAVLDVDEKLRLFHLLQRKVSGTNLQIAKFLRLELSESLT